MTNKNSEMIGELPHKGVLHPTKSQSNYHLEQYTPSDELSPFIEQFWHVEWDLKEQKPHTQQNLPQPNIHITFEESKTIVYGPVKRHFTRTLSSKGNIFGIKFTTGGFAPITTKSMHEIVDSQSELKDFFSAKICSDALSINQESDIKKKIQLAEAFLTTLFFHKQSTQDNVSLERHLQQISQVKKVTRLIESTQTITKVEQLCGIVNISSRTLQRLFQTYVGVSPKWLIRKYRIHEVLIRLEESNNQTVDWQKIVLDLEYVDQAHFINDFKYFIGYSPQQYLNHNS